MKQIPILLIGLMSLMAIGCLGTEDNNHSMEYDSLEVNFSAVKAGGEWAESDEMGIFSTCTRSGAESTAMSIASPAHFKVVSAGQNSRLQAVADQDKIIGLSSDQNFKFYAFAPYDASITDISSLPANIPATITFGQMLKPLYVANQSVVGILAPIQLEFAATSCMVHVKIPADIVIEGQTTLKKMVLKAADESKLTDDLAYNANYNLFTGETEITAGTATRTITVNFDNFKMPPGYTDLYFQIAPFTVPEGGLEMEFTDVDDKTNTVPFLAKKEGEKYAIGNVIEETLSNSSDGIVPCASPVLWPIGYVNDVGVFNDTVQPLWLEGDHIWTSAQPQATMQYVMEGDHVIKIESNNFKQYNYSSGCVKGLWTGDYFDFIVPVKNFKAGSTVTLTMPCYGRGNPLFWDVEYLDGDEWKCDRQSFTSPDGQFTQNCTFMMEHGNKYGSFEGITYTIQMLHANAIKSGKLHFRVKVAYGDYITNNSSAYSTACKQIAAPTTDGTCLFAFVNKSGTTKAISVEW